MGPARERSGNGKSPLAPRHGTIVANVCAMCETPFCHGGAGQPPDQEHLPTSSPTRAHRFWPGRLQFGMKIFPEDAGKPWREVRCVATQLDDLGAQLQERLPGCIWFCRWYLSHRRASLECKTKVNIVGFSAKPNWRPFLETYRSPDHHSG